MSLSLKKTHRSRTRNFPAADVLNVTASRLPRRCKTTASASAFRSSTSTFVPGISPACSANRKNSRP